MPFRLIEKLAHLPGVRGIKFTATSHFEITRMKDVLGKNFMVYSGADEMATSGLISGADGIIGSFYNLIPDVFLQLNNAVSQNDVKKAMTCQKVANDIILLALEYDGIPLIKELMKAMGIDAGYSRRPFSRFTEDEMKDILLRFQKISSQDISCSFLEAIAMEEKD